MDVEHTYRRYMEQLRTFSATEDVADVLRDSNGEANVKKCVTNKRSCTTEKGVSCKKPKIDK
jgi:hypothetical protein